MTSRSTRTRTKLLDEVLPEFDFASRHERDIAATPEAVAAAAESYRLDRDASPIVGALFLARGLRMPRGSFRETMTDGGFTVLAERPGEEVVLGTIGRFWALRERAHIEQPPDLGSFRSFDRPGWARGAVAFRIEPRSDGTTTLITETRVSCVDESARRSFGRYWSLIRVFSGWIRNDVLRGVARIAEAG